MSALHRARNRCPPTAGLFSSAFHVREHFLEGYPRILQRVKFFQDDFIDSVSSRLPTNASTRRHTSGSSPYFSNAWIAAWRIAIRVFDDVGFAIHKLS